MTQTALAQAARIPQPNIAALEAGRLDPQLSTLRRLAAGLGISPGKLLDERPSRGAWSRHRIDALVRRAVGAPSKSADDPMARRLRLVAAPKLAAAGRSVTRRHHTGERLARQLRAELGPDLWQAIVRRLEKVI